MSTLYDYLLLQEDGAEVTVLDNVYDTETYFYNQSDDEWDNIMLDLSKKLQIVKVDDGVVTVNLSDLIERNLSNLDFLDLFIDCDIDLIMDDINSILAGNVSEKWLRNFVNALKD